MLERNKLGQIDPYKGKNTVKYGIENEEKVRVELVYEFDHPPRKINIICKSTMAFLSVFPCAACAAIANAGASGIWRRRIQGPVFV